MPVLSAQAEIQSAVSAPDVDQGDTNDAWDAAIAEGGGYSNL